MTDISKVTTRFGRAYDRNKKAKTWLETQQAKLFDSFNAELDAQQHGQRSVAIPDTVSNIRGYIAKYHPGWQITEISDDKEWVILEEDPAKLAFTYINRDTGMVYGRTTVTGTPSLDHERLQVEDPELWERLSEWPELEWSLVRDTCRHWTSMTWSDAAIDSVTDSLLREHNVQRVLRAIDKLSIDDLVNMQEYILPGTVSVRLVPPRSVKEDELT